VLRQGDVVLVVLLDPHGQNPKSRPAVVVSATKDIRPSGSIVVAAISTRFDAKALPPHHILVPSDPAGHRITGLRRPSVVKCDWLRVVPCADAKPIGRLPGGHLLAVMEQIANLSS